MLSGALRAHVNNATQFFSRARSDNDCFFPDWYVRRRPARRILSAQAQGVESFKMSHQPSASRFDCTTQGCPRMPMRDVPPKHSSYYGCSWHSIPFCTPGVLFSPWKANQLDTWICWNPEIHVYTSPRAFD